MDNYAKNYIDTFYTGIKKTKYKISGENSNSSSFFHELNEKTKKEKKTEVDSFSLETELVLLFQTIWR